MKKKILWVTPDCFADCDIPYVPLLLDKFDIYWMVYLPIKNSRYSANDFISIMGSYENLTLEIVKSEYRERDPRKILEYKRINSVIKKITPDVIYINIIPSSPWQVPMFLRLPRAKTIITAHQGYVHEGMGHYKYYNLLRDIVYGRLKNVNMFSKSQMGYFKQRYKTSKVFQFVLGLKYFGEPTTSRQDENIVRFLSFGSINYAKHIDILLDAACNLYEQGYKNIRVKIAGKCNDWKTTYVPHIKYPEIIEEEIRLIDNNEIPNLFTDADFFVQPYRVISQSGPFKIAMRYNLPVIASDLPGFTDEMVEGVTGYTFKTNDVKSLEEVMIKAVKMKTEGQLYVDLKSKMCEYVQKIYSQEVLVQQYADMFNEVVSNKP